MICAYLLHSHEFATAAQALKFYGEARTSNGKVGLHPSSASAFPRLLFPPFHFHLHSTFFPLFRFRLYPSSLSAFSLPLYLLIPFSVRPRSCLPSTTFHHFSPFHHSRFAISSATTLLPLCPQSSLRKLTHAAHTPAQGVTIPSQIRYVGYYEKYLHGDKQYDRQRKLYVKKIILRHCCPDPAAGMPAAPCLTTRPQSSRSPSTFTTSWSTRTARRRVGSPCPRSTASRRSTRWRSSPCSRVARS